MVRIAYIERYVDDDGYSNIALLPELIRKFWWWLRQVDALVRPWQVGL